MATPLGTWYAIEVVDGPPGLIWWARTRYGRVEACSCQPPAKDTPVLAGQYWLPGVGFG